MYTRKYNSTHGGQNRIIDNHKYSEYVLLRLEFHLIFSKKSQIKGSIFVISLLCYELNIFLHKFLHFKCKVTHNNEKFSSKYKNKSTFVE